MTWARWRDFIEIKVSSVMSGPLQHGTLCSYTDPEDFLNMLFKCALCVEPFIKIKYVPTNHTL